MTKGAVMKHRSLTKKMMLLITIVVSTIISARFGYLKLSAQSDNASMLQKNNKNSYLYQNAYGAVTKSKLNDVPGAILEKVVLFSQKDEQSIGKQFKRSGILVRYPNAKGTILICHGFMCDKFDVALLRQVFEQGTYNIMTFDFRAHGEEVDFQYCTLGREEAFDVIAAAKFLKEYPQLQGLPLMAYGFSMGAVAAIEAQSKESLFTAMILDCPFSSSKKVIKQNLGNIKFSLFGFEFDIPGKKLLQKYALHPYVQSLVKMVLRAVSRIEHKNIKTHVSQFKPSESIKNVAVPCYFIHCKNDEMVTVEAIKQVYNGASGYKKLWITNGRKHFDSYFYNPERYSINVRDFVNKIVSGSITTEKKEEIVEDGIDIFEQPDQQV